MHIWKSNEVFLLFNFIPFLFDKKTKIKTWPGTGFQYIFYLPSCWFQFLNKFYFLQNLLELQRKRFIVSCSINSQRQIEFWIQTSHMQQANKILSLVLIISKRTFYFFERFIEIIFQIKFVIHKFLTIFLLMLSLFILSSY